MVTVSLWLARGNDELTEKNDRLSVLDDGYGCIMQVVFINQPTFIFPRLRLTTSSSKGSLNFGSDIPDTNVEAVRRGRTAIGSVGECGQFAHPKSLVCRETNQLVLRAFNRSRIRA